MFVKRYLKPLKTCSMLTDYIYYLNIFKSICQVFLYFLVIQGSRGRLGPKG